MLKIINLQIISDGNVNKKSHTCQGGGTPQNFCLAFIDELKKQPLRKLKTWKIKILKEWAKLLEVSSCYTCVPKITIIWCMIPEIWSAADIVFCFFLLSPFFDPKNWNLEKMQQASGVMCTVNKDHMM